MTNFEFVEQPRWFRWIILELRVEAARSYAETAARFVVAAIAGETAGSIGTIGFRPTHWRNIARDRKRLIRERRRRRLW